MSNKTQEVKKESQVIAKPPILKPIEQKPKSNLPAAQIKNQNDRAVSKDKETTKQPVSEDENKYALALVPVNTTTDNDTTTSTCTDLVVAN